MLSLLPVCVIDISHSSAKHLHCVSNRDSDIVHQKLKAECQILIIFGTNIPEKTGHQMTI